MRRKLRIWNACKRLTSVLSRVHVSAQFKRTDRTHDSYTRSFVTRLRFLCLQTRPSWFMADAASAIRLVVLEILKILVNPRWQLCCHFESKAEVKTLRKNIYTL